MPLPSSVQWNIGTQFAIPFNAVLDVSYTGQHSYNTLAGVNINNIDLGSAYLAKFADPTQATPTAANSYVSTVPNLVRFYRGYSTITQQQSIGWRTYHSIQLALTRRMKNGISFGFNDTMQLSDKQFVAPRLQHNADGTITVRADQAKAQALFGNNSPAPHVMRAYFTWDLPDYRPSGGNVSQTIGYIVNDWSLSGIWNGQSGAPYNAAFTYQTGGGNVNLTGSPDYAARVYVVGDSGKRLLVESAQAVQHQRVQGAGGGKRRARVGSNYMRGCFVSSLDLAIARTIQLGGNRAAADSAGRVQHVQSGGHHQPQRLDDAVEPGRSDHHPESAVQRGRFGQAGVRASARRGLRRRDRLPGAADDAVPDPVLVLDV